MLNISLVIVAVPPPTSPPRTCDTVPPDAFVALSILKADRFCGCGSFFHSLREGTEVIEDDALRAIVANGAVAATRKTNPDWNFIMEYLNALLLFIVCDFGY